MGTFSKADYYQDLDVSEDEEEDLDTIRDCDYFTINPRMESHSLDSHPYESRYHDDEYYSMEDDPNALPLPNTVSVDENSCPSNCLWWIHTILRWIWWFLRGFRNLPRIARWRVFPPRNLFAKNNNSTTTATGGMIILSFCVQFGITCSIAMATYVLVIFSLPVPNIHATILLLPPIMSILWALVVFAYGAFLVRWAHWATTIYYLLEISKILCEFTLMGVWVWEVDQKNTYPLVGLYGSLLFVSVCCSFLNLSTLKDHCECSGGISEEDEYRIGGYHEGESDEEIKKPQKNRKVSDPKNINTNRKNGEGEQNRQKRRKKKTNRQASNPPIDENNHSHSPPRMRINAFIRQDNHPNSQENHTPTFISSAPREAIRFVDEESIDNTQAHPFAVVREPSDENTTPQHNDIDNTTKRSKLKEALEYLNNKSN